MKLLLNQLRRPGLVAILFVALGCGGDLREHKSAAAPALSNARSIDARRAIAAIDESLISSARFLAAAQSPDGAWRSEVYGALRDGPSLTPHVLTALWFAAQSEPSAREAFDRGHQYLASMVDADGNIRPGLRYPIYSAAAASWLEVLPGRTVENSHAQAAWVQYVRQRQLDESLGWAKQDPCFGGWGYSVDLPRKVNGVGVDTLACSNISATVYGLGAMRMGGVPMSDPAYANVLDFVFRCQNFTGDASSADNRFDDGGFFFTPGEPARNKAGVAGTDRQGQMRFHSYGAATADGIRCLLHAGLPISHPRVVAARHWLEENFSASQNPGIFEPDREVLRDATYFYYCWSVAHAFLHLDEPDQIPGHPVTQPWTERLARELISRRRTDGAWSNPFRDTKEDDPLVATPHAVAALSICRSILLRRSGVAREPARESHRAPP